MVLSSPENFGRSTPFNLMGDRVIVSTGTPSGDPVVKLCFVRKSFTVSQSSTSCHSAFSARDLLSSATFLASSVRCLVSSSSAANFLICCSFSCCSFSILCNLSFAFLASNCFCSMCEGVVVEGILGGTLEGTLGVHWGVHWRAHWGVHWKAHWGYIGGCIGVYVGGY